MNEIKLLDHGYVRLIDSMGSDKRVCDAARVSYDGDELVRTEEEDAKLIRYLYQNKHTSPFEHVQFTFQVKAPIFVFRQWHRHRTGKYNEISARYAELPGEWYVPEPAQIGVQSEDNKQMRIVGEEQVGDKMLSSIMRIANESSYKHYKYLLSQGIPRELARTVLPVAMYSKMYFTMDLHNLMHFIGLRLHEHAQYEIRVYAEAMLELIKDVVPVCVEVMREER